MQWKCAVVQEKAAAHWNEKPDPIAIKLLKLWGNARIIKDMIEGRRVVTDATHSSIRGCKNSIARLATGSRATWALENEEEQNKVGSSGVYKRRYRWNERNLMQESSENRQSVYYRYGADGQRALKSSNQSETLYFNTMWSRLHNSSAYNTERESKHIYLGSERLVTRTNGAGTQGNTYTAQVSTYYYHSDHLGSAQLITDNEGREYERIEYTPYGEYWIEKRAPENKTLPFKFTGKERDEETGLYYYGARYLDPRTSRWLSADPALSDYIPMAPVNDEAKKHNQNLPGMGGIYNTVNFHLYHYAGNNPVKYIDPTGRWTITIGVSSGGAGIKIQFGKNAQKWEFRGVAGVGIGYALKFNSADESFSDTKPGEDITGIALDTEVSVNLGNVAEFSLSSSVDVNTDGTTSTESSASVSVVKTLIGPLLSAKVTAKNGVIEKKDPSLNTEYGVGLDVIVVIGAKIEASFNSTLDDK